MLKMTKNLKQFKYEKKENLRFHDFGIRFPSLYTPPRIRIHETFRGGFQIN